MKQRGKVTRKRPMQAYVAAPSILGSSARCHPAGQAKEQEPVPLLSTTFPRAHDRMNTIFWHEPPAQQRRKRQRAGSFLLAPLVAHNPDAIVAATAGTAAAPNWEKVIAAQRGGDGGGSSSGGDGGGPGSPAPLPPPTSIFRPKDEFVLLPKARLAELSALERTLQEERGALSEQCTFSISDTQVSSRLPNPFVVDAVNGVCDREIAEAGRAERQLRAWRWKGLHECIAEWETSRQALGYLNLTGYTPKEHLALAPLVSRPRVNKATLVKFFKGRWMVWQQNELEHEEMERQTMVREEAAQRQVLRGWDAQERKADYGIYTMLASLYGPLPAPLYETTPRPGDFFRSHCAAAVRVLEQFWTIYSTWRAQKKKFAARHVQRCWRGRASRQRMLQVHELYFRLQRQFLQQHFGAWSALVLKHCRARDFLRRLLLECEARALETWRAAAAAQLAKREHCYELLCARFQLNALARHLNGWCTVARAQVRVKAFIKRSIAESEHQVLDLWRQNVKERQRIRRCTGAAQLAQRVVRGHFGRCRALCKRVKDTAGAAQLQRVFRGHLSRRRTTLGRRMPMLLNKRREFWTMQKQAEQRAFEAECSAEEKRTAREVLLLRLAEADALAREGAGRLLGAVRISKERRRALLAATRTLARHEFRRTHPPHIAHADPDESATFVRQEQYLRYCVESAAMHKPAAPAANTHKAFVAASARQHDAEVRVTEARARAQLHLVLLHERGWPLFERFLALEGGVVAVRDLLFWRRCHELRLVPANTHEFQCAAEEICTRFVALEPENRIHAPLAEVESVTRAVGRMGDEGKGSFAPPDVFAAAAWSVLRHLAHTWWLRFRASAEADMWRAVLAVEARQREGLEVAFFRRRKALMLQDARAVRRELLRGVIWKRHVVAIVALRKIGRAAQKLHVRRLDAQKGLLVVGQRALAKMFLLECVVKARWHLQRQAKARRLLRARGTSSSFPAVVNLTPCIPKYPNSHCSPPSLNNRLTLHLFCKRVVRWCTVRVKTARSTR